MTASRDERVARNDALFRHVMIEANGQYVVVERRAVLAV
jgi:hypothetical protein